MRRTWSCLALALALIAGIVVTAAEQVQTVHESRSLFREYEALKREEDRLLDDWSALKIELGRLTNPAGIDRQARQELGFVEPGARIHYVEVSP